MGNIRRIAAGASAVLAVSSSLAVAGPFEGSRILIQGPFPSTGQYSTYTMATTFQFLSGNRVRYSTGVVDITAGLNGGAASKPFPITNRCDGRITGTVNGRQSFSASVSGETFQAAYRSGGSGQSTCDGETSRFSNSLSESFTVDLSNGGCRFTFTTQDVRQGGVNRTDAANETVTASGTCVVTGRLAQGAAVARDEGSRRGGQPGNPFGCFDLGDKRTSSGGQWFYKPRNDCQFGVAYVLNLCEADRSKRGAPRTCSNTQPAQLGPKSAEFGGYSDSQPQLVRVCNVSTRECYSPPPRRRN